jgi:hypothetical protein
MDSTHIFNFDSALVDKSTQSYSANRWALLVFGLTKLQH